MTTLLLKRTAGAASLLTCTVFAYIRLTLNGSGHHSVENPFDHDDPSMPAFVLTQQEVDQHNNGVGGARVWATRGSGVYDLTDLISRHHGGVDTPDIRSALLTSNVIGKYRIGNLKMMESHQGLATTSDKGIDLAINNERWSIRPEIELDSALDNGCRPRIFQQTRKLK